jgi:formate dehydrogenase maturation protein FdhE
MRPTCTQCNGKADLHIYYLAKRSNVENEEQECGICNECLKALWGKFSYTQWGQTLVIEKLL